MNKIHTNPKHIFVPKQGKPLIHRPQDDELPEEGGDPVQEQQNSQVEFALPYNLININGVINEKTTRTVTDMLLAFDIRNQMQGWYQPIHLLINSPGGSVTEAWQICDIMDAIGTPVFTIGTGQIASAALTIFINGEPGYRVLSEHTSVMSHQYSWGVAGKMDDLVSAYTEFKNIYNRMEGHFARKTGLSKKVIKDQLLAGKDNWMTAKEAKKMKLADQVFDFKKTSPFIIAGPPPELVKKQKELQEKAQKEKNGKPSNTKK